FGHAPTLSAWCCSKALASRLPVAARPVTRPADFFANQPKAAPARWTRISAPRFAEPCVPIPGTQGHMPCAFPGNSAAQFLGKSGAGQARGLTAPRSEEHT